MVWVLMEMGDETSGSIRAVGNAENFHGVKGVDASADDVCSGGMEVFGEFVEGVHVPWGQEGVELVRVEFGHGVGDSFL